MDELACAAFGQNRTPGRLATKYAVATGGPGPCRIVGTAFSTSPAYAALANGTAGHADEMDGAHVVGGHPGATIVHAVCAVAEHMHATGADLLNAVVLGYEVGNRLIKACGGVFGMKSRLHMHADFLHAIGAATAASRLLGLGVEGHVNAMALATFQANGLVALFKERRHISKSLCNGQYAFAGVSASLMAASGLEGCDDVLGADDGLLAAWGASDGTRSLIDSLGDEHAIMGANFKFINAGYPIHAAIEAAMTVVRTHQVDVGHIEVVEVGMPTNAMRVVDNRTMHNICLQDMLAAALIQGGHRIGDRPFPALLSDPAFRAMRGRIDLRADAELDREQPEGRGARVTLAMRDGSRLSHRVDAPKGHSTAPPITWDDLATKWAQALPALDVDRLTRLCRAVDLLDDVQDLLRVFDPRGI
jgi:2-methylcitrate dehydratase PrpD